MGLGALGAVAVETARAPSPVATPAAPSAWIAPAIERADREPETRSTDPVTPLVSPSPTAGNVVAEEPPPQAPSRAPSQGLGAKPAAREESTFDHSMAPPNAPIAPAQGSSEISVVTRAHQALADNPLLALDLVREHELRFPFGALAQEREVIAIQALLRLARRSEAEARATRFRAQYPGSAHARRIDVLLSDGAKRP
jgi:hypothetical protein